MKNLYELSDKQKSVMLARLCGWKYKKRGILGNSWWTEDGLIYNECYDQVEARLLNLYDPDNMALAWRVLNWAENKANKDTSSDFHFGWMAFLPESLFEAPPEEAQHEWLDKILSLAIEVGMVEVQNAND